jgi:cytochrome P450
MSSNFVQLASCAAVVVALVVAKRLFNGRRTRSLPVPPGPKPLPIIGNMLDVPTEHEWKRFAKWGQQYGDIVSLNVLGQTMIVLNNFEDMNEMLGKKVIYSDRPVFPMIGELCGFKNIVAFMHYNDSLLTAKKYYKVVSGSNQAVHSFASDIEFASHHLLGRLLDTPEKFSEHLRTYAGQIILKMGYGWKVDREDDKLVKLANYMNDQFSELTKPGRFLVDFIPAMKYVPDWFPGAEFKRIAKQSREALNTTMNLPFDWCKQQIAAGTGDRSFVSLLLDRCKSEEDEHRLKQTVLTFYIAGADTQVSQMVACFKALAMYPEALKNAQEEIDRVVGPDRLVELSDRPNLPYVEAIMEECFRWHIVVPTGVPHRLMEDDVHKGYFIHKGSWVIANAKGISRNPSIYPNPEKFDPSRYLSTPDKPAAPTARNYLFGFGRRECPGQALVEHTIWLALATTMAMFDITPCVGEDGKVEELKDQPTTSGTICHQMPFRLSIRPRSERTMNLIRQNC